MSALEDDWKRHLDWEGCFNVRDLGGLATKTGRRTRQGRLVRADSLEGLTPAGWSALSAHGVRTVIDLREPDEIGNDASPRPASVRTIHLPLDGSEHREFWEIWGAGPQFATPLYYGPHLERFPERSAAVISAIARADPGGVVYHCGGGRDRTGQITMLVLALVGVSAEDIAADYALSIERVRALYAARGRRDDGPLLDAFWTARGTTASEVITTTLAELDVETRLVEAGVTREDLVALRQRLLDPR
jgi:hypothetical protein